MKWLFWTRPQSVTLDNCETIDPLLSLYADGMASPEEVQCVTAHLPGCEACRESLAWMQATQRALAGRPVVRPPADLRARIAAAIAASSAAPVTLAPAARPSRSFILRPAYAAAASLTIFGIAGMVGYSLLHEHQSPSVHTNVTPPRIVASLPDENSSAPTVKPNGPNANVKPTVRHHAGTMKPVPTYHPVIASRTIEDEPSSTPDEVKPPSRLHSAIKSFVKPTPVSVSPAIKPHVPAVKKPIHAAPLMANNKIPAPPAETHTAPAVQPEPKKPDPVVAAVPNQNPPTIIAKPIITQDPTARVASSHSDSTLAMVNDYARHLRTAEFKAKVARSMSGAALAVRTLDENKTPSVDINHGSF